MENGIYTKEERKTIYENALSYYKIIEKSKGWINNSFIGMCVAIHNAMYEFINIKGKWSIINAKNFPEFFEFKPKRTWKKNKAYWFSPNINYKGYEKRLSILTALVDGKTPEQWKKEWKAAGNR